MAPTILPLAQRFELNAIPEPNSGCWLWLGSYGFPFGVPRPRIGDKGKIYNAARVSFQLHKGSIPSGLWILHTCHNTHCVNPDHLYAGTPKQNTDDMMRARRHFTHANPEALSNLKSRIEKINAAKREITHCKRGHALAGHNLIVDARGYRACRQCQQLHQKVYRAKIRKGKIACLSKTI